MFSLVKITTAALITLTALTSASPIVDVNTPNATGEAEGAVGGTSVGPRDLSHANDMTIRDVNPETDLVGRAYPSGSAVQICAELRVEIDPILAKIDALVSRKPNTATDFIDLFLEIDSHVTVAVKALRTYQGVSLDVLLQADADVHLEKEEFAQIFAAIIIDVELRIDAVVALDCDDADLIAVAIANIDTNITDLLCIMGTLVSGLLKIVGGLFGVISRYLKSLRILGSTCLL